MKKKKIAKKNKNKIADNNIQKKYLTLKSFYSVIISLMLLFILFSIKPYKIWLKDKIVGYYKDFNKQKENLDVEYRKQYRYGTGYYIVKEIVKYFEINHINKKDVVFLLPKQKYYDDRILSKFAPNSWAEPIIFYHWTEIKPVLATDKSKISKANYTIIINENESFNIIKIKNKQELNEIIKEFNNY